jgi:hypothetical protein
MDYNKQIEKPNEAHNAEEDLLSDMYLSNVKKRLRALNQPTENDRKRWVWELIQNAKDSISKDPNRSSVDIEIEIKDNIVKFIHNGAPFTYKARLGLLYKYSKDKGGAESTGRFGTGFLTTHCLSKIVTIEGDVKDKNSVRGFSVTMYRNGQSDDELLAGIKKMKDSEKWYQNAFGKTTFTYVIQTENPGRDSLVKGTNNFYANIAQTLLFCPEVGKLSINDNGEITSITRLDKEVPLSGSITLSSFQIGADSNNVRRFIKIHSSESNAELTQKYKTTRDLRLDLAVEIDNNNDIVYSKGNTQLYCVLPLVGTEAQLTEPLYINCPDFEPDEERQRLLLSGNETIEIIPNEEDDDQTRRVVTSETGINRLIYKKVVELYDILVKYLSEAKYGKLYNLAIGLKGNKQYQDLDLDWFNTNITKQYRHVLTSYDIVKPLCEDGCKKLSEVFVVKENATLENKLYLLMKSLFPSKMIAPSHNHSWAEVAWKELNIWDIEKLCEYISSIADWNRLGLQGEKLYSWYNSFLELVKEKDGELLNTYALLPDCIGQLHSLNDENLKQGKGVTPFVVSILGELGIDIKNILLDPNITAVQLDRIYNSSSFSSAIDKKVKEYLSSDNVIINEEFTKKVGTLVSIIPPVENSIDETFNTKRTCIFKAVTELYDVEFNPYNEISYTGFTKQAWESLDLWLLKQIFNKIASLEKLSLLPSSHDVIWLNNTLKGLVSYINVTELAQLKVLPNQDGDFCTNNIDIDDNIPSELKSEEFVNLGAKITNRLLDNKIEASVFGITSKLTISDVSTLISQQFNKNDAEVKKTIKETAALHLITLLPKEDNSSTLYKNQSELLDIAHIFLREKVKAENKICINHNDETLWSRGNKIIVELVLNVIRTAEKLETLQTILNLNEAQTISALNKLYCYLNKCGISYQDDLIVPNQEGTFCAIKDMRTDFLNPIDESIKDISKFLADKENLFYFRDILAHHGIVPQPTTNIISPMTLVEKRIIEISNQVNLWQDYKEPISRLFEEIFPDKQQLIAILPGLKTKYDSIMMNIVWNAEDRKVMQNVRKRISKQLLNQLDSGSIEDVIQKIENVDKLQEENRKLQDNTKKLLNEIECLKNELQQFVATSGIASSNPTIEDNIYFEEIRQKSELYVYEKLKGQYGSDNVIWNNSENESYMPYDFLVKMPNGVSKYIECKGTPKDKRTFYMSRSEWFFYQENKGTGALYEIYRVNNVETTPFLTIIDNLDEWIEKKVIAPLLTSTETIEGNKIFMTILN